MAGTTRMQFDVVAERVQLVTPHMQRIRIDASALPMPRPDVPAQWLKVFIPGAKTGRAYTVRHFDTVSKKLDLDFVLHGDNSQVSAWAARVKPGDLFKVSSTHPRSGFVLKPTTKRYILLGDETALPAICSILEKMSANTRVTVLIEVAHSCDEQSIRSAASVEMLWLHREIGFHHGTGSKLEVAARAIRRPDENTVVWVAAESSSVKALRRLALLEWGVEPVRLYAAGYWKRDEANHKDEEASL